MHKSVLRQERSEFALGSPFHFPYLETGTARTRGCPGKLSRINSVCKCASSQHVYFQIHLLVIFYAIAILILIWMALKVYRLAIHAQRKVGPIAVSLSNERFVFPLCRRRGLRKPPRATLSVAGNESAIKVGPTAVAKIARVAAGVGGRPEGKACAAVV